MGQTVHLAARMEQNAPEGGVLLTPAVVRLAEGYVDVRSVGPLAVNAGNVGTTRLTFAAALGGTYRVSAGVAGSGAGAYELLIREFNPP